MLRYEVKLNVLLLFYTCSRIKSLLCINECWLDGIGVLYYPSCSTFNVINIVNFISLRRRMAIVIIHHKTLHDVSDNHLLSFNQKPKLFILCKMCVWKPLLQNLIRTNTNIQLLFRILQFTDFSDQFAISIIRNQFNKKISTFFITTLSFL